MQRTGPCVCYTLCYIVYHYIIFTHALMFEQQRGAYFFLLFYIGLQ